MNQATTEMEVWGVSAINTFQCVWVGKDDIAVLQITMIRIILEGSSVADVAEKYTSLASNL